MAILKALAVATILASLTSAAPVQVQQKRDLVYETVTQIDVTTIDTTVTVFAPEATPALEGNPGVVTHAVAAQTTTTAVPQPTSVPPAPETTSYAPPPPPPTTAAPPPPPTTTAAPPPPPPPAVTTSAAPPPPPPAPSTTTAAPQPAPSSGGSGGTRYGDGTFYQVATSMTSPSFCDTANDGNSENVVALSVDLITQEMCGKTVTVSHNGKTATGTVVDKCMSCTSGSVDMSVHMFNSLADASAGRIPISWVFDN